MFDSVNANNYAEEDKEWLGGSLKILNFEQMLLCDQVQDHSS